MFIRGLLGALFVAAFVSARSQDFAQTVNYTTRAKNLQSVLLELSGQTHVELQCSQDLAGEPIILRLKQVPLKEVMDKIAQVTCGEWVKRDKAIELRRSPEAEKRHLQAIAQRVEQLKLSIAELRAASRADRPLTKDEAAQMAASMSLAILKPDADVNLMPKDHPSQRFLTKALEHADLAQIAELSSGQIAFASSPGILQTELPGMDGLLEEFTISQNLLTSELYKIADTQEGEVRESIRSMLLPISSHPLQCIVKVQVRDAGKYSVDGRVYSERGMWSGGYAIIGGWKAKSDLDGAEFVNRHVAAGLDISPKTRDLLEFANRDSYLSKYDGKPFGTDIREEIMSPAKVDPLSFATTDLVLGISSMDDVNAVFLPTDHCEVYRSKQGGFDTKGMLENWYADMSVQESGGWLVGMPLDPLEASKQRLPRAALDDYLKALSRRGFLALEDTAAFALALTPDNKPDLALRALQCCGFSGRDLVVGGGESLAGSYSLLGMLTPGQWETASKGTLNVEFGALDPEQSTRLIAFWSRSGFMFAPIKHQQGTDYALIDIEGSHVEGPGLGSGRLVVADRVLPAYVIDVKTKRPATNYMTATDLGREAASPRGRYYDFEHIQVSEQRTIILRIVKRGRDEDFVREITFKEKRPGTGPQLSLNDVLKSMTPDLRKQYNEAFAKEKENQRKEKEFDATAPPPPAVPPASKNK